VTTYTHYTQKWEELEAKFPGCSATFDRDLGDAWLQGRDGPRFDQYGPVLKVFVGDCAEVDHHGPWASAYYDQGKECWVITKDERGAPVPPPRIDLMRRR
jgi:hypothetical protein